jgi:hypothetical protein
VEKRTSSVGIFLFCVILSVFIITSSKAQEASPVGFMPEFRFNYGYITSEKILKPYLNDDFSGLYELAFSKETYGLARWEIVYKYPRKGISFFYSELGNKNLLGSAVGAIPFVAFPLFRDAKFTTWLRTGIGAAYFTEKFNYSGEIPDRGKGNKVNAVFNLSPSFSYNPTHHSTIFAGFSFFHFTNAGVTHPAYFFNYCGGFAGLSIALKDGLVTPSSERIAKPRNAWKFTIMAASGYKELGSGVLMKRYFPLSVSATAGKWVSSKFRFGFTGDIFYDKAVEARLIMEYYEDHSPAMNLREGAALNFTWAIGPVEVPLDFGIYIFPVYVADGSFYNRYGIRYFITDNFFVNTTIKSHFFKPDHLETGLGYSF